VRVFPGAAAALRDLAARGFRIVLVTNQAGIARGFISPEQCAAVNRRMEELLAADGARLDGLYLCPHAPDIDGPCPCRKPGRLLYDRAIRDLDLDPGASWFIGDRVSDLLPALTFGGRGLLVETGLGAEHRAEALARGFPVAADLAEAAGRIG
jgi:D-glycero-D-manno-heptose 1,7-bisphosphate phosphatase